MKNIIVKDDSLYAVPYSSLQTAKIIEEIRSISQDTCIKRIILNLCNLNIFDALKVAVLASSYGITKNIDNKYEIIVENDVAKNYIKNLALSNLNVRVEKTFKNVIEKNLLAIEV